MPKTPTKSLPKLANLIMLATILAWQLLFPLAAISQAYAQNNFDNPEDCETVATLAPASAQDECQPHGAGDLRVDKRVDNEGDGTFVNGNASDFKWGLDSETPERDMGTIEEDIPAGSHNVTENTVAGYHFVGWYDADQEGKSCANPNGRTQPLNIEIKKDTNHHIVLCNAKNKAEPEPASLTIVKDAQPDSHQDFDFQLSRRGEHVLHNFHLDDDNNPTLSNHKPFTLAPGDYSVAEGPEDGWSLHDVNCSGVEEYELQGNVLNITLQAGDNVTCTFINVDKPPVIDTAKLTIVKDAQPDSHQNFHFQLSHSEQVLHNFQLDDDNNNALSNHKSFTLAPGSYSVSEGQIEGWKLTDITCDGQEQEGNGHVYNPLQITLEPGDDITCTFTNRKNAEVSVTKYNDLNRNGHYDEGEPTLSGWDINLKAEDECLVNDIEALNLDYTHPCYGYNYDETQHTDENGVATFSDLKPNKTYVLSESLDGKDGWHWSDTDCNYPGNELGRPSGDNHYLVYPGPGEKIECFIGNYHDVELLIDKTNNRPEPTITGDTVTYTLIITNPGDDSQGGTTFNTCVTDLAPENFNYVPGSWTATSNNPEHNIESDVEGASESCGDTGGPNYSSPGQWFLGTLLPGEVVILTYRAFIANVVSPGTYPDAAFVAGNESPAGGEVLGKNVNLLSTPFVGTKVSVDSSGDFSGGQVLGASTLPRTSLVDNLLFSVLPPLLFGSGYFLFEKYRVRRKDS